MRGYTLLLFSGAPFSRGQGVTVVAAYRNVFIQDDPGMHFHQIIRNAEGQRCRRCRNSESDAEKVLDTRLAGGGPPGQ